MLGASGSGKSTLLRAVNGLVPHTSGGRFGGDVVVFGRSTRTHHPRELADVVGLRRPGPRVAVGRRPRRARPRVRAREPRVLAGGDAPTRRGGARRARHRAPARPRPVDAVGRRAPAVRDRGRAGRGPAGAGARRAHVAARPAGRRRRARRARAAQPRPRHHRGARRAPARARRAARRSRGARRRRRASARPAAVGDVLGDLPGRAQRHPARPAARLGPAAAHRARRPGARRARSARRSTRPRRAARRARRRRARCTRATCASRSAAAPWCAASTSSSAPAT